MYDIWPIMKFTIKSKRKYTYCYLVWSNLRKKILNVPLLYQLLFALVCSENQWPIGGGGASSESPTSQDLNLIDQWQQKTRKEHSIAKISLIPTSNVASTIVMLCLQWRWYKSVILSYLLFTRHLSGEWCQVFIDVLSISHLIKAEMFLLQARVI